MKLKYFEIKGFKTFPDKTVLDVRDGLTAVVGPNGSGKSNIAEALRWVLGEQNPRALRCEKRMEEIIFHGTETRPAVGFAEVSLCLERGADEAEGGTGDLVVTRRLYRSGESEYFLGKTACRLKDIQELLMDTGLGQDGYSIIGQGMIGRIISDKFSERRRVFEEACGISRYRHRKEDAERKLENAGVNLLRAADKIEELEPQAQSLKAQAETARAFLLLRDELRDNEINLWLDDWDNVRAAFMPLKDSFRAAADHHARGVSELNALYAREEALEKDAQAAAVAAEDARNTLTLLEENARGAESRLAVIAAEITHHDENITRIVGEIEQSHEKSGGLAEQKAALHAEREELQARLDAHAEEIKRKQAEANALAEQSGGIDAQIGLLRLKEDSLREEQGLISREQADTDARQSERQARRQTLLAELDARAAAAKQAAFALETSRGRLNEAQGQVSELENVLNGYALRRESRQKRAEAAREKLSALELEHARVSSRERLLAEQEKERQGFSGAVKAILQENFPFVHGTLADLISVENEYALAIETALGAATQHIVLDTEENAKTCVNFLKNRSAGRATFLPLSSVTGRDMDAPANARGFVGVGSSLVRADARYESVISSLLGRTAVVETMDDGISLARASGYRYRIVTLDGQVLNAGGSITGGSAAKSTGLLARRNELSRLEETLSILAAQTDEARRALQAAERELSGVVYDADTAAAQQRAAQEQLAGFSADVLHGEAFLDAHNKAHEQLSGELDELDALLSSASAGRGDAQERLAALSAAAAQIRAEIESLGGGRETLDARQEAVMGDIGRLREERARLSESVNGRLRSLEDVERLEKELSGDALERQATLDGYRAKKAELLRLQAETQSSRGEHARLVEEQQAALREIYANQQRLEQARSALTQSVKEKNEENARLQQETARLENQIVTSEAEERAIADKLWTNYELTYTAAAERRTPMASRAKTARRAAELKKEIAALGNPNLGAIEAYDEIARRLELLTAQYTDAQSAKTELEGIIAEITGEMRGLFTERFALINGHFQSTFTDIFGGGQAHLELLDPDDPLGSDIEIKSQPPGKKMRSISLLSGGETSLTAIALYFALFKVRPAPFCVLDEIDHDLDEANVDRFAKYLARLSGQTQYVAITHRRGTMEQCDTLYGVTTQEAGVSKVLVLKFEEAEKLIDN